MKEILQVITNVTPDRLVLGRAARLHLRVPEAGQRVIVWAQGKSGFPFVFDYEGGGLRKSIRELTSVREMPLLFRWKRIIRED